MESALLECAYDRTEAQAITKENVALSTRQGEIQSVA